MKPPDRGRLVYTTGVGRICPACRRAVAQCACARAGKSAIRPGDGVVRVRRETQGRAGRTVTTIAGIAMDDAGLAGLTRELKQHCGAGGSLKAGVIEIQGDHRERIVAELRRRGFEVRPDGG